MTTWNCAVQIDSASVEPWSGQHGPSFECGTARAVGVLDCPECGTDCAPFRENGEGDVYDFVDVSALGMPPGTEWVPGTRRSGTGVIPEREE